MCILDHSEAAEYIQNHEHQPRRNQSSQPHHEDLADGHQEDTELERIRRELIENIRHREESKEQALREAEHERIRRELIENIRRREEAEKQSLMSEGKARRKAEQAHKEAKEQALRKAEQERKEAEEQARREAEQRNPAQQPMQFDEIRKQFIQDNIVNVPQAFRYFGLPYYATYDQVRSAFKRTIMRAHPDKGGSDDQIKQVNAQYEILQTHFRKGVYEGL